MAIPNVQNVVKCSCFKFLKDFFVFIITISVIGLVSLEKLLSK